MSETGLKNPMAYSLGDFVRSPLMQALPNCVMACYDYWRIIFFELVGTALFAYGICCSQNQPPPYPTPTDYIFIPNPAHSAFVSMSLFLAICWCGQLTGGHCNPAVTTVFIMKKDSGISLKVGLVYMLSQVLGAFVGCFFGTFTTNAAWILIDNVTAPIVQGIGVGQMFQEFGGEIFGTFVFTIFILIVTCKETTFVDDTLWIYVSIVTALYIARTYLLCSCSFSFRTEGLNPALAIGMEVFYAIYHNQWIIFADSWVLIVGPFIGAVIASVLFEHFSRPLMIAFKAKQAL